MKNSLKQKIGVKCWCLETANQLMYNLSFVKLITWKTDKPPRKKQK